MPTRGKTATAPIRIGEGSCPLGGNCFISISRAAVRRSEGKAFHLNFVPDRVLGPAKFHRDQSGGRVLGDQRLQRLKIIVAPGLAIALICHSHLRFSVNEVTEAVFHSVLCSRA